MAECGWNIGGCFTSKCVVGLVRGGPDSERAFSGCGGPKRPEGKCNGPELLDNLPSPGETCCRPVPTDGCRPEELCWSLGFLGPRSCCTAVDRADGKIV